MQSIVESPPRLHFLSYIESPSLTAPAGTTPSRLDYNVKHDKYMVVYTAKALIPHWDKAVCASLQLHNLPTVALVMYSHNPVHTLLQKLTHLGDTTPSPKWAPRDMHMRTKHTKLFILQSIHNIHQPAAHNFSSSSGLLQHYVLLSHNNCYLSCVHPPQPPERCHVACTKASHRNGSWCHNNLFIITSQWPIPTTSAVNAQ